MLLQKEINMTTLEKISDLEAKIIAFHLEIFYLRRQILEKEVQIEKTVNELHKAKATLCADR